MNSNVNEWLNYKLACEGKSEQTTGKYERYMSMLSGFLGEGDLLSASSDQLVEFTGLYLHKMGLTAPARKPVIAAVRGFYKWAFDHKKIDFNPAEKLIYPKLGKKIPIPMGLKNAEKILVQPDLTAFSGLRDTAILSVLFGCGARISGVTGLNEESLVWYEHSGSERLAIKLNEKGKKERLVPAPSETMLLLRAYLGHLELKKIDRTLENGEKVLFVSVQNRLVPPHEYHGEKRRISNRAVDQMIKKYGERAGVPTNECHAHAARHLYGVELAEESATALESKSLLGHEDVNSSAIYMQLALRKLTKVVDKSNPLGKIQTPVSSLVKELTQLG